MKMMERKKKIEKKICKKRRRTNGKEGEADPHDRQEPRADDVVGEGDVELGDLD